jgi:hypothetical protein
MESAQGMRKSRSVVLILTLSLFPAGFAGASDNADPPAAPPLHWTAERLFGTGELPLIFVGSVLQADRSLHPCRITCGTRWATFSVKGVLYGFSPGDTVKVAYDSGSPPRLFSSEADLLVFAVGGYSGTWKSIESLLLPATPENIRDARRIAASHRDRLIARFEIHHTRWEKLVFVGTVAELWPEQNTQGLPCKQPRPFPVLFKLDQLLSGSWADKQVTVVFADCVPPPDPPIHVSKRMIVMAGVVKGSAVIGYLKDLIPDSEIAPVTKHFPATNR